jgi:hypothetical protein
MIIMIVLVFDPLALTLILAANKQFEWARQGRGGFVHDEPKYEPDDGPLTEEQIEQIKQTVEQSDPPSRIIPTDPSPPGWMYNTTTTTYPSTEEEVEEVIQEFDRSKHPYLDQPFAHFKNLKPMVAKSEPVDMPGVETEIADYGTPEEKAAMQHWKELNPGETLKSQRNMLERGEIAELPWMQYLKPAPNSSFGNTFPDAPARGDSFVRTDVAPNQLFKFNGDRWILVDKATADNYTYDTAYIDHLIDKINSGTYDVDLLSASEQEQVAQRLQTKTNNT